VIYRDGGHIRSAALDGRITELAASATARERMMVRSALRSMWPYTWCPR